ncbi:MAG: 3-phosphoshikimate 1-carboxyvinyltransferase [Ignavibacteria bacterium]|jgi:3-phosphoshikimate 1-carboxyvinyltransferase|nr:3-phosphoshikimate 1-carboxyvinyltransferase [Ignavibacteria bacterium]MCU7504085.1 3-phosphoshikimate 1-carboxyvinyltransferase [Ignavibacteria bacterium]MCU7518246.1 3-phosphoshikimate 1-carboxyvinyltransferase [Ignavibacteria bacterium]
MDLRFQGIEKVNGALELPGDKSISHRAVIFSALADGTSYIENLSNADDVKSTMSCFKRLGCSFEKSSGMLKVTGRGFRKFNKPEALFAGNSGTTARLLSGILVAQPFASVITGDESLSMRPMKRVVDPLSEMGGIIKTTPKFTLPVSITPSEGLHAIEYRLPVASAQVKSAVLLAGLHLEEETSVVESIPSRDHTERLLSLKTLEEDGLNKIYVSRKDYPSCSEYFVPSDISTAAFFIVLTLLSENSNLVIRNISLNKTRTGIIEVLRSMGANIQEDNLKTKMGEEYGDLIVSSSVLHNVEIPKEVIPNIIDEIPILSIAGLFAEGDFRISNARELRVKETDRISAICKNMRLLGPDVTEEEDGFEISGSIKNENPTFDSFGDHRIAMAFGILSSLLKNGGNVSDFDCVRISNPDFLNQLKSITN